ncbi:hypothetical protein [Peribacillus muralis]
MKQLHFLLAFTLRVDFDFLTEAAGNFFTFFAFLPYLTALIAPLAAHLA